MVEQKITNYGCWYCGQMTSIKEYPSLNIIEGDENVSVYDCLTPNKTIQKTAICVTCKDLLRQIIQEEISSNKSTKK